MVFRRIAGVVLFLALFVGGQSWAAEPNPWSEPLERIYWGDLHVHTSYSVDAYIGGMAPGRYADEAGQYALYCSRLDFYAVTDHAEMLTHSNYWTEAVRAAQSFNQIGATHPDANGDPGIVAFTGWEWTLSYLYGHKNVILKYDDPKKLPPSPIRCRPGVQGYPPRAAADRNQPGIHPLYLYYGYRQGQKDTTMVAWTSGELFNLLDRYCLGAGTGCRTMVIPHGNAWGMAKAMDTIWEAQLDPQNHDPQMQRLIEVYSKHGNSEEYSYSPGEWRYFKDGKETQAAECVEEVPPGFVNRVAQQAIGVNPPMGLKPECQRQCAEPTSVYLPCCWQAGEIVRKRCLDPDSPFCREQIELARAETLPFPQRLSLRERRELKPEFRDDPGKTAPEDWSSCGQCRDCWQPAFNYRFNGSVQKALASAYFDESGRPLYYRFGFIGSTDTHSGWPASVKETKRMVELGAGRAVAAFSWVGQASVGFERVANFLNPGGMAAILADHRTRDDLWQSLEDRNVYSTSGARIEVWARAVIQPGEKAVVKMGAESASAKNPTFFLKAHGAFREDDTCPYDQEPLIQEHFSRDEFQRVCQSQCYRTKDQRVSIARIEVVKVLQPLTREEAQMANLERSPGNPQGLIMDPYAVVEFNQAQVEWTWSDPAFEKEPAGRWVAYYFRIIQSPTPGYNCRPIALLESGRNCDPFQPADGEVESRINPQDGSKPAPLTEIQDACYSNPPEPESYCQERAWTSPFYIQKI